MNDAFTGDRIILQDLGFFGYHGVLGEEARLGQRFFVDLEVGVDLSGVATSDDLDQGISYAEVYEVTKAVFEGRRMKLIEAVAHNIVTAVFEVFPTVRWVKVRIRKPEAPIVMVSGGVAVELHRMREAV